MRIIHPIGSHGVQANRRSGVPARIRGDSGDVRLPVIIGALVGVVALVAVAIQVAAVVGIGKNRPPVAVIGDSITEQGQKAIFNDLSADYKLTVDGKGGFRIDEQLPTAERFATRRFDQVIIELGTNDVMQKWSLGDSEANLRQIVSMFPDARCVHLVDVNESLSSRTVDAPARARQLNQAMRGIAASDSRVDIIDWAGIVRRYETVDPAEPITTDGIHPGPTGQDLLVSAYEDALKSCSR